MDTGIPQATRHSSCPAGHRGSWTAPPYEAISQKKTERGRAHGERESLWPKKDPQILFLHTVSTKHNTLGSTIWPFGHWGPSCVPLVCLKSTSPSFRTAQGDSESRGMMANYAVDASTGPYMALKYSFMGLSCLDTDHRAHTPPGISYWMVTFQTWI